ncbi:MAG: MoaD/ThiS family protein [Candidatus Omnitrophota bacterium]
MLKIKIPGLLQQDANDSGDIDVEAKTIPEAIRELIKQCPQLEQRLCDPEGRIKQYIRFYINQEVIETDKYQSLSLRDDDLISIIIPVAGG